MSRLLEKKNNQLMLNKKVKVKVKLYCDRSRRLGEGMECWASILTLTVGTIRTVELSASRAGRPRKFFGIRLCYSLRGTERGPECFKP